MIRPMLGEAWRAMGANRLRTAIHLANRRIFRTAESNDDYNGMGTTIVAAQFDATSLIVAHVGDSRLYRLRAGVRVGLPSR